ncbi:MAG: hypothetical protein R3C69_12590 [Geminicoccaceae bacterium]
MSMKAAARPMTKSSRLMPSSPVTCSIRAISSPRCSRAVIASTCSTQSGARCSADQPSSWR